MSIGVGMRHIKFLLIITAFICSNLHLNAIDGLFTAIANGIENDVEIALLNSPDLTATNIAGDTPLLAALKVTSPSTNIIGKLLDAGADVNTTDSNGDTPLLVAINGINSEDIIDALLSHTPNIDDSGSAGDTPLLAELKLVSPSASIIGKLLDAGASVNARDNNSDTPILVAINGSNSEDIIDLLLSHTANIDDSGNTGDTPLLAELKLTSPSTSIIGKLLDAGASVNARDNNDGRYPLHFAQDNIDLCKMLLSALANPNAQDNRGKTLLHTTTSADVATLLLQEGAKPNVRDNNNNTPLHTTSSPDIAQILVAKGAILKAKNSDGNTALHMAQSPDLASYLVNLIPVNVTNNTGETPLHLAQTANVASILLNKKADASIKDIDGNIPLHKARDEDIAQLLINKDINFITAKNNSGAVPLHYARSVPIAAKLISAGVNAVDNYNNTPLHTCTFSRVTEYLIKQGADVNAKNKNGDTPLHTSSNVAITSVLLAFKPINVNAQNNFGDTALHITNDHAIADALLAASNINIEAKNILGRTPLHSQCIAGNIDEKYDDINDTVMLSYGIINSLISKNANLAAVDNHGNTPLHYFISTYNLSENPDSVLDTLFAADKNAQNRLGESPLVLYLKGKNILLEKLSWWFGPSNGYPVDPSLADYRNVSPLHLLNLDMDPAIWQAIFDKSSDTQALLDALDVKGRTPLHQAVINSQRLLNKPPQSLYRYDAIIKAIKNAYGLGDFSAYVRSVKDFNNNSALDYADLYNKEIADSLTRIGEIS